MSDLFRNEVVERQTSRLLGDILVLPRFSHSIILGLLLVWVVIVAFWLITNTYARKETAKGWLEPPQGVIRVYAQNAGTIKEVLVKEGDTVVVGQPLLIINGDRYLSDGEGLESQLMEEFESQRKFLQEQLERTENIFHRKKQDINQRMSSANQDLVLLQDQLMTLNERHKLVVEQVRRIRSLVNDGHVSEIELDQEVARELGLRNERQALIREKLGREIAFNQLKTELELLPDENANTEDQLRARLSDVAQQIANLSGQRAYVIKAVSEGVVSSLQARVGYLAASNPPVPLMVIAPVDSQLSVRLLVPIRSAAFIEEGQQLDIRYDAFPYQKFGLFKGTISEISDTVLMPNEIQNLSIQIEEPVYMVTAEIDRQTVGAYSREFALKPGMTLSADVRLGDRTLLQWLLEPIFSLQGRL